MIRLDWFGRDWFGNGGFRLGGFRNGRKMLRRRRRDLDNGLGRFRLGVGGL
jgi:hypothetical protein